jgi:uncharacterized protein (DUF58 family)
MSPTPRAALLVGLAALAALVVPLPLAVVATLAVGAAAVADAFVARRPVDVRRRMPAVLYRGVEAQYVLEPERPGLPLRLRQPVPPDVRLDPSEARDRIEATLAPRRRGRHALPRPALRVDGPLGLGRSFQRPLEDTEVLVYPDLPAARRLARAVRESRFREAAGRTRGQLGLGTEFESIRDYLPDDDIRRVNWQATARLGRPMSNEYRVEQDRDVICVVDAGRLMAAPLGDRTRLDAALDAVAAIASVADEVNDRCGVVLFDRQVRHVVRPRRRGARAVIAAVFDAEPVGVDSDYELAFLQVADAKRAWVLVLTDLLEEAAARPLLEAVPMLARRHAVAVASAADPDLDAFLDREPERAAHVYATAVALDVLEARSRVAQRLRHTGAQVIEAPPDTLGAACVRAYLRAKLRARL